MTSRLPYGDRLEKVRLRMAKRHYERNKTPNPPSFHTYIDFNLPEADVIKKQPKTGRYDRQTNRQNVSTGSQLKSRSSSKRVSQQRLGPKQLQLSIPSPYSKQRQPSLNSNVRYSQLLTSKKKRAQSIKPQPTSQQDLKKQNYFQYVLRYAYRTRKGHVPSQHNKVNQDSYILFPQINRATWQHYFGICDGHGSLGHYVSAFLKENLPKCLVAQKDLKNSPKQSLSSAFKSLTERLVKQSRIDLSFSGSTCVGVYMQHDKLFTCNVGDSRALIIRKQSGRIQSQALSLDHKPDLPSQRDRIQKRGGSVEPYRDVDNKFIGPARVWVKGENYPGLAMSRSFGDLVGASVGITSIPQITQYSLSQDDKIIIIGSDGVFEFLSNQQIAGLVSSYYPKDLQRACDKLLEKAHKSWLQNCNLIDDISFIMIFMQY